ncbi:MAG: hypothetical protein LBV72_03285 [Tannerella sp.]|jgi:hypothetical protein|nr:hypothetical protein [Tannerella sp.]
MSWDIVLFNSRQIIKSIEDVDENLLEPTDFCRILDCHFNNIQKDDNHRSFESDDFAVDYYIDSELVSNKILHLYGEKALYEIVLLARKNNWQIFDTSLDEMIDLDKPDKNGYESFNKYLQYVLENASKK